MLFPINFSIPQEKIVMNMPIKTRLLAHIIPGDLSTYIYKNESDYYKGYQESLFAITKKKWGWDCMRHYEIMANGCIPVFLNIENCPKNTMALWSKDLLMEGNLLYDKYKNISFDELTEEQREECYSLIRNLLNHVKEKLTTCKIANYILEKTNYEKVTNILFLSGTSEYALEPDYLRCITLHGFKSLFKSKCHDYPKIPHIYKSFSNTKNMLHGKGMTYSNLLDDNLHDDNLNHKIEEDIKNKFYDIIIYGSYHRGMPFYELANQSYKPGEIIILCGEDIHKCSDVDKFLEKGHTMFIREL